MRTRLRLQTQDVQSVRIVANSEISFKKFLSPPLFQQLCISAELRIDSSEG